MTGRKPIGLTVPYREVGYKEKKEKWVGLTDEEIKQMGLSNYTKVVREVEAKLKAKNI